MAEEGKGKIEKFNGMNLQWWKMQVEDYLYQKDLYLPLVGEKPEAMNAIDDNSKVWYVDSGASIHCMPHRDCFSNYVHGDYGHVTVGNGYRCSIVGKGKVEIKLSNRGTLVLKDVRHIPEMQNNIISVSGLDREGYFVAFGEKQWKVTKGSMVVARGERVGTLYTLSGIHNHFISLAFTENQITTLWHHRLGHLSESGMKILHSKNALPGMKNIQLDFCESCVYGKQKRVSFWRDGKEKKIERLELVHMDVCGPTTVKSLGGNFYFVSFIDNASRKTWIYAIRQKSDVYHTFKKWKILVENETGNKFWAAAVDTVIYLINRSPESAFNGGIPEEEWSGKPVNYSFLRVFGCITYAHIDKEERKKLDSKSQKCVFIGYGGDEYDYRLWDYEHNKIIRSRDVIFDESQLYKHKLQEHGIEKDNREYMELDEPEDGQVQAWEGLMNSRRSKKLANTFSMKDLGEAKQLLGIRITSDRKQKKLWLSQEEYIEKLGYGQVDCKLWTDSQSAIHLAKNSTFHSRTKHIQLRNHFIRSLLEDGQLNLQKIEGNKNPADMLTKVLGLGGDCTADEIRSAYHQLALLQHHSDKLTQFGVSPTVFQELATSSGGDCTVDEIHSAYRRLALQRHPDKLTQFGVSPTAF
ncbi:hypothetical protein RJ639_031800 [Escallonia herrerae]|uniref:J domain-containing protein n=1 Tax=Escallonia herrerae TaxID=1293975 RepID=A0AA88X3F6_9ASTE|nr:hypothetical protein RJ639_031800 [Escallonia herrerae]